MKFKAGLTLLIAATLLAASVTGLAQKKSQNRPQTHQSQPVHQERTFDQGRAQARDRADQKDQKQARDEADQKVQKQDQDRAKTKDQAQTRDQDIYGYQLMNEQERNNYREQLKLAETNEERLQFTAEHREKMQARARTSGIDLEETEESE